MKGHLPHHHGPPHLHHGSGRHGPGASHRLYSAEKTLPLRDVGRILASFGASLVKSGRVHLGELEVTPPDPCETKIHLERTPVGHMILKVELKWGDEDPDPNRGDAMDRLLNGGDPEPESLDGIGSEGEPA
jgi:hypothetical protein